MARTQGVYIAMFGGFNALLTLAVGNAYDAIGSLAFLASAVPPALAFVILIGRSIALRDRIAPRAPHYWISDTWHPKSHRKVVNCDCKAQAVVP